MKKEAFLHPLLLLSGASLIFWLVWTKIPTEQQMNKATPDAVAQKPIKLPDVNRLTAITDFTKDGFLLLEGPESWKIKESRFYSLNETQTVKLREFFVGKLILLPRSKEKELMLPLELYDSQCFSSPRPQNLNCPIILER